MTKNPLVSVLMCTYNDQRYVKEAVDSILKQTFTDFEFIIIDDGSTDETPDILRQLKDSRIKLFFNLHNLGLTKSLIKGIEKSNGTYIARIDSNDKCYPHRLETQLNYLRQNKVGLLGSGYQIINTNGEIISTVNNPNLTYISTEKLISGNKLIHSSVIFSKSLCIKAGNYREFFTYSQDYDLWLRMSEITKVAICPEILTQWRLNLKSISVTKRAIQIKYAKFTRQLAEKRQSAKKDLLDTNSNNSQLKDDIKKEIEKVDQQELNTAKYEWMQTLYTYHQYKIAFNLCLQLIKVSPLNLKLYFWLIVCSTRIYN